MADPAVDPPRRIELPSKGLRFSTTSVGSAALGRDYGALVRSTVTISAPHRRGGGPSTHCRFRPLSMAARDKAGVSLKQPPLPPLALPPLLPSQTLSAMASTLTASPTDLEGQWTEKMHMWNFLLSGTSPTHLFSHNHLPQKIHPSGSLCELNFLLVFKVFRLR